ncbi:MAG: hypothetical protein KAJ52_09560 [Sedimentisphaerales bacterium]|nr:hypothetical protein [Sedimentisphaerales bacterium]
MYTRQNLALGFVLAISMIGISYGAGGDMGAGTEPLTNGSAAYPYLIEDLTDFDVFADQANAATYWASGVYTKLTCDPNLTGRPYTTAVIAPYGSSFEGIFDGDGHIVSNLTIDTAGADKDYLGLFGKIEGSGAQVKNLGIENINITGGDNSWYLGGLCGYNGHGTITNCYATGSVTGGYNPHVLGGLCGYNYEGTITNCYAAGSVTGGNYLGGLCGHHKYGTISNCYATGLVTGGDEADSLGGLCGKNYYGSISNCYATGSVTGDDSLGGLCGSNDSGTITNSYATGSATGDKRLGGLCGENYDGTITNCYATGFVIGGTDSDDLGGLCGFNWYGIITDCYATGSVTGGEESYHLGGLCGFNWEGTITNCYATGSVTSGDNSYYLGGLCGLNLGTITNCFWDVETSGIGSEGDNNYGAIGKTTEQMQTQSTFTDANWDFSVVPVWHMPFEAIGYPMLGWQKDIPCDFTGRYGVYMDDFAVLSNAWLSDDSPTANWNEHCDLNANGVIDPDDLRTFAENWLCD